MKRRLNLLCIIVMLVLGYSVLETGYYFFIGAKAGIEAVSDPSADKVEKQKLMKMKYISLVPYGFSYQGGNCFPDSVRNEKSGAYVPASYSSMAVSIDTHPSTGMNIVETLMSFLELGMYIWAVVLFIRLIVAINKSDIFNWRNVRRLRRLGLALIVGFCCAFTAAYINFLSVDEVFSLSGYELSISDMISSTILVLGLCSLIVGEVFAIGLRMKEEQDLTI